MAGASALALSPIKLCFFALVFRLPCPGCGMTRAAVALARGDLAGAIALNPLSLVIAPWCAWLLARHVTAYVRTGALAPARAPRPTETALACTALGLLLALWAARFFGYFGGPVAV